MVIHFLKLKAREVDLRAMENQRKKDEGEKKLTLMSKINAIKTVSRG